MTFAKKRLHRDPTTTNSKECNDMGYHNSNNEQDCPIPGNSFATSNLLLRILYKLSLICINPWCLVLDIIASMFIHTSMKNEEPYASRNIFYFVAKVFFLLILFLCLTPIALVSFLIWLPLQLFRPRPFSYICSQSERKRLFEKYERIPSGLSATGLNTNSNTTLNSNQKPQDNFAILTANLCLLPECAAHFNNLHNTVIRGKKIAKYLCKDDSMQASKPTRTSKDNAANESDFLVPTWSSESFDNIGNISLDAQSTTSTSWSVTSKEKCVSEVIPTVMDFLCLQEVFDSRSADQLLQELQNKYPYIIYDVAWPLHDYRLSLLSSGLCIASKYPFLKIDFKPFKHGHADDKIACKGLLMTKIDLGLNSDNEKMVGYLSNTHLQAWSHDKASKVRFEQLNCIQRWMEEFYNNNAKTDEKAMFKILTGDFNFDKISHHDLREQKSSLFEEFIDPCIDHTNGQQHSWVVGTELQQRKMYDRSVRTPQGLQRMMISELERCQYVASTLPSKNSLPRVGDGKRRIDYILYRPVEHFHMQVQDFKFFTGLATLSDHIPIGMYFSTKKKDSLLEANID